MGENIPGAWIRVYKASQEKATIKLLIKVKKNYYLLSGEKQPQITTMYQKGKGKKREILLADSRPPLGHSPAFWVRLTHCGVCPHFRYRVVVSYPPQSKAEIELKEGDIVFVHKKREDGWYKGTVQRNGRTGLFPGSFVESF